MEFRILGPLEVTDGDSVIEVKAPKQRLILTVLALANGSEVSAERLLQELWGEYPPGGGLKTLQYHVSKLRDTLQPGREPGAESVVVTRPNGYALAVSPDCVDAARFERIVRDARRLLEFDPSQAAARLREALDLWRGPLPTELLEAPLASLEARRLIEMRLTTLEDRINADIASGRHVDVVPELQALVAEYPLRERLWAQLMVALYRCDRQAEALRAYQRLRTVLGEELGIEPSPDLRRLEGAILLQQPDLDVPEGLRRPASLRGYELHERIGEGAFGVVWRAAQRSVEREVAIKVVRAEYSNRPGFVLGFQAEALRLATLQHPHIVPVFDFWRDPDGAYLVMQLMANGSLEDVVVGTWETSHAIRVIEQLGLALAHAHRAGMVHGDLHPGNILFDGEGNGYLADFGLASFLSGGSSTPPESFAAPEQLRGEPPDAASDVYSFGRLAFLLLAGTNPGTGPLPPIATIRSDVPGAVNGVLRRSTDPDPSHRYGGASEFLDDLHAALGDHRTIVAEPRNPYKGLRAFAEADAPDFFGRDAEVEELLIAIAERRLVAVVGPSGCGKSSLVRAGLIPALREGRVAGSDRWLSCEAYPGVDPFVALGEALRSVAVQQVPGPSDPQWHPDRIVALVHNVLPAKTGLVLFIDQFEELFTLCTDEAERIRFMEALLALLADPEGTTRLVMTLRADYYGLPLEYRPFGDLMRGAVVGLTPPGPEQLVQAITGPAAAVGLTVEPELIADIVADTTAEPGALPLMEYALTRLFDEQTNGRLTLGAYRTMGGLAEALGAWPESLFTALGETDRTICRQVFLRLVSVDESGESARRRVPLPELHGFGFPPAVVDDILGRFAAARLLTFDNDSVTRVPTVEIAHEALLTRWLRLREWVDEYRESLIMYRRYRTNLADWERADRDPDYLLLDGRLRQFESWQSRTDLALTDEEEDYLRASRELEDDAASAKRQRRRLVVTALGLLAVVALVFGIVALVQRNRAADQQHLAEEQAAIALEEASRAEEQAEIAQGEQIRAVEQAEIAAEERSNAESQERIARARGLAGAAASNLETDTELSVLLAIEAVETTRRVDGTVLREAEEALHAAAAADRLVSTAMVEMWSRSVAYAPEGDIYYVGGRFSGQVIAAPSGSVSREFAVDDGMDMPGSNIAVLAVAGADDELLVVAHYSPGVISVLSRETLEEQFVLEAHPFWVKDLDVSADGTTLASVDSDHGMVVVWDLVGRVPLGEFPLDCSNGCSRGVAISADGTMVTSGNTVRDVATGEVRLTGLATDTVADVEFIDTERMILADGMTARVVDLGTGATLMTLAGHGADIRAIDVAAGGRFVATGSEDGLVNVWDVAGTEALLAMTLAGHAGTVWEVQFSPDGRYLTSTGGRQQADFDLVYEWPHDWEARTWDVSTGGSGEWLTTATRDSDVAFSPDGRSVVVAGEDTGAAVWDLESETEKVNFDGWAVDSSIVAVAFSPDGTAVALGGISPSPGNPGEGSGWVAVFDATTGAMTTELVPPTPDLEPKDLEYNRDGSALALAAFGLARVWETGSWKVVFTPSDFARVVDPMSWEPGSVPLESTGDARFTAVAFHPDGDHLFTQYEPFDDMGWPTGSMWNIAEAEAITDFDHFSRDGRGSYEVSPDGRLVVSSGSARPNVLEPFTARTLTRLGGGSPYAVTAAFSPDGTWIATGEADGTVRLWDAATGEERLILAGHSAGVVDVTFGPEGKRLASVSLDATMRVWAVDLEDLLTLARAGIDRELTDAECRAYIGSGCPPATAPERLVPATGAWDEPYGIHAAAWADAETGGTWAEEIPGRGGGVLDPDSRQLFVLNGAPDASWVLDFDNGERTEVTSMPVVPGGEWPYASIGAPVYHPGLRSIITIRLDDGVTMAYDVVTDEWSEIAPAEAALIGRYGNGIVYDAGSDRIVLFGGREWGRTDEGKQVGLADTWVLDAATGTWTDASPAQSPPARTDHVMVYDAAADRIVVFGGATKLGGDVLGDTWAYDTDANTWTEMSPTVSPPGRAGAAAWYDPVTEATFVFGGSADWSSWPSLPWMMLGGEELWAYDTGSGVWTLYRANPNPGYRLASQAVFDAESNEALLFGGDVYDENRRFLGWFEDTWTYRHDVP